MHEIDRLRHARGEESVTFADVADHLDDFARRQPDTAAAVARLAAFLTSVERVPHAHPEALPGSSVSGLGGDA